jgi:hypothetical protein
VIEIDGCTALTANRKALVLGLLLAAVGVTMVAQGLAQPMLTAAGVTLAFGGLLFSFLTRRYEGSPLPSRRTGRLVVSQSGILLDGRPIVAHGAVTWARVDRADAPRARVRLLGREGVVLAEIEVESEAVADRVIEAAGLGRERTRASFALNYVLFGRTWFWVVLGWMPVLVCFPVVSGADWVSKRVGLSEASAGYTLLIYSSLVGLIPIGMGAFRATRTWLEVGRDGLVLCRLGRSRYVSFRDLAGIEPWGVPGTRWASAEGAGLDLLLRTGERISLRTLRQRQAMRTRNTDPVAREIERALASYRHSPGREPLELPAFSRPVGAWVESLRAMGRQTDAYRLASLSRDALWAGLEDPREEPLRRIASAIVLQAGGEDPERICRMAGAVADPKLRRALQVAAEGGNVATDLEEDG